MESCAALFIDLSKAFDVVDHSLLIDKLGSIGLTGNGSNWFRNYLLCSISMCEIR